MPQSPSSADLAKKYGGAAVSDIAAQFGGKVVDDQAQPTTADKPASPKHPLAEFGTGVLKGIASTAIGAADLANRGVSALGLTERIKPEVFSAARQEFGTPTSAGQSLGKGVEQVAELATPIGLEGAAVKGFANAPRLVRAGARILTGAAEGAGKAAVQSGGDASQVKAGAVGGAAVPAVGAVTQAAAKYGSRYAQGMMQSALKPGVARMRDVIKGKAEVPRVVQTLLDEGINVTPGGAGKIDRLLKAERKELDDILLNSTEVVYPEAVAQRAEETIAKLGNQVAPIADQAAATSVMDEFMRVHGGAPNLPAKPIPIPRSQQLKTGTYQAIGNRGFGEVKGATTEAEKALARGLKETIEEGAERQSPSLGSIVKAKNAREGRLMEAQEEVGRRVAMAANRDPAGLAWLASNPAAGLAALIARHPGIKSMLARGMYASASRSSKTPEWLLRGLVLSLATSGQDKEPE